MKIGRRRLIQMKAASLLIWGSQELRARQSQGRKSVEQDIVELDINSLKVLISDLNVEISDARMVLAAFKNVRGQPSYSLAITMLLSSEKTGCGSAVPPDQGASPKDCNLRSVDLDGISSFQNPAGQYDYSPQAVFVINSTMELKVKQLTLMRERLESIYQYLSRDLEHLLAHPKVERQP